MNKIDKLRAQKGLSYASLAQKTGLTPTYIYCLAKGKRKNPSLNAMQRISSAFGEKVEEVFSINESEVN